MKRAFMTTTAQNIFNFLLLAPFLFGSPWLFVHSVKAVRQGELLGIMFAVFALVLFIASISAVKALYLNF